MTHTPPPASPQSALSLQILGQPDVLVQTVSSGKFAATPQELPAGQSWGSSQAMVHSPGHCEASPGAMQLGPPTDDRQQMVFVRLHCVDPHVA